MVVLQTRDWGLSTATIFKLVQIFESSDFGRVRGAYSQIHLPRDECRVMSYPSQAEIESIIAMMHPLKAPGPDGMRGSFYRNYWDITGAQVVSFLQEFFRSGRFVKSIN